MPSPMRKLGTYLELVYSFPVAVLLPAALGWLADRWLGTSPWLVFLGFVLGLVAGFWYLMQMLRAAGKG